MTRKILAVLVWACTVLLFAVIFVGIYTTWASVVDGSFIQTGGTPITPPAPGPGVNSVIITYTDVPIPTTLTCYSLDIHCAHLQNTLLKLIALNNPAVDLILKNDMRLTLKNTAGVTVFPRP